MSRSCHKCEYGPLLGTGPCCTCFFLSNFVPKQTLIKCSSCPAMVTSEEGLHEGMCSLCYSEDRRRRDKVNCAFRDLGEQLRDKSISKHDDAIMETILSLSPRPCCVIIWHSGLGL